MLLASTSFAWRFGGPLAGLPPALAWSLLALLGLLGAAWIIRSYRRTLVTLAPAPRRTLVALRLALWALLLVALAGPTRVERVYSRQEPRPLAVLVDQSGSMTTPDNRRQRRLDDSLRRWRALAPAAGAAHREIKTFAFADSPAPATLAAIDTSAGLPSGQTRFFGSLDKLLASAPPGGWGGVVTLTDGLDTTTSDASAALAATGKTALATGTPLYFLPGRNRYSGGDQLSFREINLPARVPPRSKFRLELTLDSYQSAARFVPLHLKVGDTWRAPATLQLSAGRRALAWHVDLDADAPGTLPLELRVGDGPAAPLARAEVHVAPPDNTRILYYQGALDWGYRFLADILRRDPAFALTPIFNIAPAGAARPRSTNSAALPSLPSTAAGFADFDIVVLANATADQFSPAQQTALSTWVRSGGVLVFLTPDDDATQGFANSEIEKMLPVTFAPSPARPGTDSAVASFREQMGRLGSHAGVERDFASNAAHSTRRPALSAFAWEPRAAALLGPELVDAAPRFANFARVRAAKPGAEILARHPTATQPGSPDRAILLALQRYGRGQSAVLASDALWRWKLHQPSRERGAEKFWQNLFAWLARERERGLRFERPPLQVERGRTIDLRVADAPAGLVVTARRLPPPGTPSPSSASDAPSSPPPELPEPPAPLLLSSSDTAGARVFSWTAAREGVWEFYARAGASPPVRHWITVATGAVGESSGLPADEHLLRSLAERTGGALLSETPPAAWAPAGGAAAELLRESLTPVWHQAWIFAGLLGLYVTELILRRRWRLL